MRTITNTLGVVSGTFFKRFQNNKNQLEDTHVIHHHPAPVDPYPTSQYIQICAQDAFRQDTCLKFQGLSAMQTYNQMYKTAYYQVSDYMCNHPNVPYGQCWRQMIPGQPGQPYPPQIPGQPYPPQIPGQPYPPQIPGQPYPPSIPGQPGQPGQPLICTARACPYNPVCARSGTRCRVFANVCELELFNCNHRTDFLSADNVCPIVDVSFDGYCIAAIGK